MASGKRENEARGRGGAEGIEEIDGTLLQYQNQKLVQQLESQKTEMHGVEEKFKELKEKQMLYDDTLMTVNKIWNQLIDDLVLLGIQAGRDLDSLQALDHADCFTDTLASCPVEEMFLRRFLIAGPADKDGGNGIVGHMKDALSLRHSSTLDLMKCLQETIATQRAKSESIELALCGNLSSEDAILQIQRLDGFMREEASRLCQAIDGLHQIHKRFEDEISSYRDNHPKDQSEINRLSVELEENMAELEESRRKLVSLQMQKNGASVMNTTFLHVVNGSNSPDKPADRSIGMKKLKDSIEEAKILAASRLLELQEAQEDKLILSKQLEDLKDDLKDDKNIVSSRPYTLLNEQLQHMTVEIERYKGLIESLQAERNQLLRKDKELSTKAESADAAATSISNYEARIKELELQIPKYTAEKNDLEVKLEEARQDLGRKDIKDEIHVMGSALSREMEMMETQLNRSKEAACEALSLHEEAGNLKDLLAIKIREHKNLSERCAEQMVRIKSLKVLVEELEREKQELQIIVDMYGQECFDNRTIIEIKKSEHRARAQAELLTTAIDEHSLELRVKAANQAEAACQQRLSAAESEIAELRPKLDTSERHVLELKEAISIKDADGEAYISEIETIGQAYEDMQTQNQHLVQMVADRDEYNIKLVSDSVKMKQTYSSLLAEKQAKARQLQQINGSMEAFKTKIARGEEQMKAYFAQAAKVSLENRHIAINMDKSKLELANAERELKWLRSAVDSSEKEYEQNQNRVTELKMELERERNERIKLEEELGEVKNEVEELSSENEEATIQKLQDEIKECKAILKCGVCFDRPKEVVITKCFHLFCNPCIQRNLEIRHRKCPGCGTPFGQNDVREVKI